MHLDEPAPIAADDPRLGLVLSGGAAFGAAHVGVLQVLEERGIRPGIVAGTSSGALVGAAYAGGVDAARIEEIARGFRWSRVARWSFRPRWSLLDSHAIGDAVVALLGEDPLIEDLPRRFAAVATDVKTRQIVALRTGRLSTALRATMAVPGLLPAVRIGDHLLADGGMADNVPFGTARESGAERLIIVRLHAKGETVRMMRTVKNTAELVRDPSVVLIQPELERMSQWSLRDVPRLIEEGRRTATLALDAASERSIG